MGNEAFLERFRPKELLGYKPYVPEDSPEPIPINDKIFKGRVAKYWGLLPSDLRMMSIKDQAELIGLYMIERELDTYQNSEQIRRMKNK